MRHEIIKVPLSKIQNEAKMKQDQLVRFKSEDGKIVVHCETDISWASLHDFMMYVKGYAVDKMVEIHKQEQELARQQKESDCSEQA